jgi:hypothetical protein
MDNQLVKNHLKKLKRTKKLSRFTRKVQTYQYMNVEYLKLKPYTYTVVLKDTQIITKINGKVESKIDVKRGDYVVCGPKGEKYGLPLEKIVKTYDLASISTKIVERLGFQLKNIEGKKGRDPVEITASWGETQNMEMGDYIMLEFDKKSYYGVEKGAFKKTYDRL